MKNNKTMNKSQKVQKSVQDEKIEMFLMRQTKLLIINY